MNTALSFCNTAEMSKHVSTPQSAFQKNWAFWLQLATMVFIAGVWWRAFQTALVQLDKLEGSIKSVQDANTRGSEMLFQLRMNQENMDGKIRDLKDQVKSLQERLEAKKIVNVLADNSPPIVGEKHTSK